MLDGIPGRAEQDEIAASASQVLGLSVVQPSLAVSKNVDEMAVAAVELLRERFPSATQQLRRFAVRARRRDKSFVLTSTEIDSYIGRRIERELAWPVDLSHPDAVVTVEVDHREAYVCVDRQPGQGGLPVGSSGSALVLLSGGFDSPVAAYRAMRRGLRCEFVHFGGAPYTSADSTYKAYALVRHLDRYQGGSRLHVVTIGKAQRALATSGAGRAQVVAHRRLMVRVADRLARRLGAEGLVTGDNLGQVASQTLSNLATTEDAASLPLLRPLLAWDKEEIIAEARRIGTHDISVLPDQDCCSLFIPPWAALRTSSETLTAVEERAGGDDLVDAVLSNVQVYGPIRTSE